MLNKLLAVEAADLDGLPLSAGAGFCVLCSYFYLQPLSDALALKVGLEYTPAITASNVVLIAVANPLYASLVKALPVKSVLPIVYGVLASLLVVFGVLFTLLPDSAALSFCFAVFTGTFSLFLTTTFWARMASLHTKPEAKRVFGVIASGAQVGQLCASISAAWLYAVLQQRIVFWSALLVRERSVATLTHPHSPHTDTYTCPRRFPRCLDPHESKSRLQPTAPGQNPPGQIALTARASLSRARRYAHASILSTFEGPCRHLQGSLDKATLLQPCRPPTRARCRASPVRPSTAVAQAYVC